MLKIITSYSVIICCKITQPHERPINKKMIVLVVSFRHFFFYLSVESAELQNKNNMRITWLKSEHNKDYMNKYQLLSPILKHVQETVLETEHFNPFSASSFWGHLRAQNKYSLENFRFNGHTVVKLKYLRKLLILFEINIFV